MSQQGGKMAGLSEVVLRTGQYEVIRDFYKICLDRNPMLETRLLPKPGGAERIAFFRILSEFPFTQTLAIFEMSNLAAPNSGVPGLHHFQMQLGFLPALFDKFEALRAKNILPARSANHGPATSFYYEDPDRNLFEISAQNYDTEAEQMAFIKSDAFKKNPAGVDIDPHEFTSKYRAGTPISTLRAIA